MAAPPLNIRALKSEQQLELVWSEDSTTRLPFQFLRGRCPCANCVNEITGKRMVGPEDVDPDVSPTKLGFSGNYALTIHWSDNHHTGLFTWDYLAELSAEIESNQ